MNREELSEYGKNKPAFVALEVADKTKVNIEVLRTGETKLQALALCTFLANFAKKNGKQPMELIPMITEALVRNTEVAK